MNFLSQLEGLGWSVRLALGGRVAVRPPGGRRMLPAERLEVRARKHELMADLWARALLAGLSDADRAAVEAAVAEAERAGVELVLTAVKGAPGGGREA